MNDLIHLTKHDILLVKGYSIVECMGNAHIFGFDIKGKTIKVREGKTIPIEPYEDCDLRINDPNQCKILNREGIGVSIWNNIRDTVLLKDINTIIIVGASDTGKSSLTVYLTNLLLKKHRKVFVIDGDVGQGDLAPPGCIGACNINKSVLELDKGDLFYFIGSITPYDVSDMIIDGIKRLYEKRSCNCTIINTDGYIDKEGLTYKIKLIDSINPDMIISLGSNVYSNILLNRYDGKVYTADKPRCVEKDKNERILNRLRRYKKFIDDGRRVININSKKVWLLNNTYTVILKEGYMLLEPFGPALPFGLVKDLYVALSINEEVVGFGVIRELNGNKLLLQTSYEGELDTLMLSNIKLSNSFDKEYIIRYNI